MCNKTEQYVDFGVTDWKVVGINAIDVDKVCKNWNKSYLISKWRKEYNLYGDNWKTRISEKQALELIKAMDMKEVVNQFFNNGSTFYVEDCTFSKEPLPYNNRIEQVFYLFKNLEVKSLDVEKVKEVCNVLDKFLEKWSEE